MTPRRAPRRSRSSAPAVCRPAAATYTLPRPRIIQARPSARPGARFSKIANATASRHCSRALPRSLAVAAGGRRRHNHKPKSLPQHHHRLPQHTMASEIPLLITRQGRIYLNGEVNGIGIVFHLDTGADGISLSYKDAAKLVASSTTLRRASERLIASTPTIPSIKAACAGRSRAWIIVVCKRVGFRCRHRAHARLLRQCPLNTRERYARKPLTAASRSPCTPRGPAKAAFSKRRNLLPLRWATREGDLCAGHTAKR
jgi:hypothetical protein